VLPSRSCALRRHRRRPYQATNSSYAKNICKVGLLGLNYSPVNQKFARVIHSNAASAKKEKNTAKEQASRETVLFSFFTLLLFVVPSGWLLYALQAVWFVILFDRLERSFGRSSDRPAGWLLFIVWFVVGMMYGMLFVCYLVRRLVCTLLGVLLNMLLYAWLGMLLDSTLLGDTSLMCRWYVLGVIGCCVIVCCHCLVQVVFRWNRAVGITFINKENPENRTQMTNWMMISKKVKKFNKILVWSTHIISYLFSYLCWYRAHMLLATYIYLN